MRPYISIIVPVYNAEAYLGECLNSILTQTLKEIEVICVDDGSPDSSAALLKQYEKEDARIRLIAHESNRGTLQARKDGVLAAAGQYIMFVDPDDSIESNACEFLLQKARETGADIIGFGMAVETGDALDRAHKEGYFSRSCPHLVGREIVKSCYVDYSCSHNLCNKMFEAELCKKAHLELPDRYCTVGEDAAAFFVAAYYAREFVGLREKLYHYRTGVGVTGTVVSSLENFEAFSRQADAVDIVQGFLEKKGMLEEYREEFQALEKRLLQAVLNAYIQLPPKQKAQGLDIVKAHWGVQQVNRGLDCLLSEEAGLSKDVVLHQFAVGRIGFRYIVRYLGAWLKFKIYGGSKDPNRG